MNRTGRVDEKLTAVRLGLLVIERCSLLPKLSAATWCPMLESLGISARAAPGYKKELRPPFERKMSRFLCLFCLICIGI
jgi:hypothetical protein